MSWEDWGEGESPEGTGRLYTDGMYYVIMYRYPGMIHLLIHRKDHAEIKGWDELQRIKNELGEAWMWGYEVYPPESNLVNVANSRHLWLFDKPLPFGYRFKASSIDDAVLYQEHKVIHGDLSAVL